MMRTRIWLSMLALMWCIFLPAQKNELAGRINALRRSGQSFLFGFRPDSALKKYDSALLLSMPTGNPYWIGSSMLGAAQAQWYMGRTTSAIDTIRLAIAYLRKANDDEGQWERFAALRILSNIYDGIGDYENAFAAASEALARYLESGNRQNVVLCLVQLASLYRNVGEYPTALHYYQQAQRWKPVPREYEYRELYHQLGRLYAARGLFDSAQQCYARALPGHPNPRVIHVRIGEAYLLQNKPDEAMHYLSRIVKGSPLLEESQIIVPALIGMGKVYLLRGQTDAALDVSLRAFNIASQKQARHNTRDASQLLSEIYLARQDSGAALQYYRRYVSLKDSVVSEQFKGQLYTFRQKAEEARHAAQLRWLRWGILAVLALGGLVIFVLLLRTNNVKLKMQRRAGELEMLALRAQMNPHFIFNCLSAINHFILNNDTEQASRYLTRFSRLIRLVLANSGKANISLEEELDMLKLYLDMEQLRFVNAFDYTIAYDAMLQPSAIQVPSFILQPFCENAIWHGLLHKNGKGDLRIDIRKDNGMLVCAITDNGIGREAASIRSPADKTGSFGHKLSTERLVLFNRGRVADVFTIEDLKDAQGNATGTRVVLRINKQQML